LADGAVDLMGERRFSRLPYFIGLVLLVGLQFFLVTQSPLFLSPVNPPTEGGAANPLLGVWGLVGLVQLLKIPLTIFRLNDLGRPQDDVLWALVPGASMALAWICLTTATPSEKRWQKLHKKWSGQLSALGAYGQALILFRKTIVLGAGFTAVYGLVSALVAYRAVRFLGDLQELEEGQLSVLEQGLWGLTLLLGLYTLIQFSKRKSASRSSWFPSLFLLPAALLAGTATGVSSGMHHGLGLLFLNLPWQAWGLVWQSIGGAMLAIVWIRLAQGAREGRSVGLGELFGQLRSRTADVAGAHGARVHAVLVGMQVLVPGIFYALQLAFTDMVAVLYPDRPALKGSGELTWGIRGRLFKVFALWLFLSFALSIGVGMLFESPEVMQEAFLDLRAMSLTGVIVQELLWVFTTWLLELALLAIFWERAERKGWSETTDETAAEAT
jgi:hypothetical protein